MPNSKLKGKIALVTGGSRGIGAASALRLAEAGCRIALLAQEEDWLKLMAVQVRRHTTAVKYYSVDVTDSVAVGEAVEAVQQQFGGVDILVNSAGTIWPLDLAVDADPEEWAYNIHTNLVGPFYLVNALLPGMVERGFGRIVNLTCSSGASPKRGESAYRAAKAGLEMWTRVVREEVSGSGVQITCLDPGIVDTELRAAALEVDDEDSEVDISAWKPDAKHNEIVKPEEVAQMILWLVGPWSTDALKPIYHHADSKWRSHIAADLAS